MVPMNIAEPIRMENVAEFMQKLSICFVRRKKKSRKISATAPKQLPDL